jgi:hypothetical protein
MKKPEGKAGNAKMSAKTRMGVKQELAEESAEELNTDEARAEHASM